MTCVKQQLLPNISGHHLKALAGVSLAMALAQHCTSGPLATHLPSDAKPASRRRQIERLVSNSRVDVVQLCPVLCQHLAANFAGLSLVLMLDETPGPGDLLCLKLSLGYHHRALPLAWCCYRNGQLNEPMPVLVQRLIRSVAQVLPAAQITLLADRGFAWPQLIDLCRELAWHFVLRIQSSTRVMLCDGTVQCARHWTQQPYDGFAGSVRVFKKAGWRDVNFLSWWHPDCREPWLLISDRPALGLLIRTYAKRMWCEQGFRDEKSSGFQWRQSRIREPDRAARLLLIMMLATILAVMLAAKLIKQGQRSNIDPHRTRRLSYLQLGLRQLQELLTHDQPLRLPSHLYPP
jgi:hypothetical protein